MAAKAGHAIGTTAIGGGVGGGVGAGLGSALADVLVELIPRLEPVEGSVGVILSAALAVVAGLLGAKFSPTNKGKGVPVEVPVKVEVPVPPSPEPLDVEAAVEAAPGPSTVEEVVEAVSPAPSATLTASQAPEVHLEVREDVDAGQAALEALDAELARRSSRQGSHVAS